MLPLQSVEILKKLDKKELKRFGDFLSSPYFNQSELILKIFEAVKKEHPEFTGNSLSPEKMFKKLYPSEVYIEKRIQNLYSEFGRLLREFLGYEKINKNNKELDVFIAEELSEKGLHLTASKLIRKKFDEADGELYSEDLSFFILYRLNSTLIHNLEYKRMQHSDEYLNSNERAVELLSTAFLRDLFMLGITHSINKKLFNYEEGKNEIEHALKIISMENLFSFLKKTKSPYESYIKVFYFLYHYTSGNITEDDYLKLKKEILKIIYKISKNDALYFIIRTIQIILSKLIPIDRKYYEEIFELSKLFCSLKLFPNSDIVNLAAGPFRDMFTVAVILKEFDWAENFVKEQSQFLSEDIRENELNFCMGNLSFKRGKFEESLEFFNKVEMIDIIEKINIRFYYMMNYIELKSYESALSSLNTIRQFYHDRKDEIPEMFAVLIPDALKYFNEIIKCEEQGIKLDEMLYKEAKDGRRFYHVNYILGKMEKLAL